MTATIELFFSTYSAFAYLGHAQLLRVAAAAKRRIIYRPFDLRALFAATGHPATGGLTEARRDYFFGREIERWAEHRGVPVLVCHSACHLHFAGLRTGRAQGARTGPYRGYGPVRATPRVPGSQASPQGSALARRLRTASDAPISRYGRACHGTHPSTRELERNASDMRNGTLDHIPASHGSDLAASSRMLIAALRAGHDGGALAGEMLRAHWVDGADLANREHLLAMAARVGLDGSALLQAAADDEIGALYAANTAEAIARGVFGSPTYFVDGDMFYGQDRLELVARACQQPYARRWRGAPA
ncbi:MAG: DsbA family protein [Burkholderiaceae bacterium]